VNKVALEKLVAPARREIDLGDYSNSLKGEKLTLWVNAPQADEQQSYYPIRADARVSASELQQRADEMRAYVGIVYELDKEFVGKFSADLLLFLNNVAVKESNAYYAELRKN